jgi:hypothetical protein
MKFCLVGKDDELLFIETNFLFAIPDKEEKYFEVCYIDEKLEKQKFIAKKIESSEFMIAEMLFLNNKQW